MHEVFKLVIAPLNKHKDISVVGLVLPMRLSISINDFPTIP
jgi:hypothetical protein